MADFDFFEAAFDFVADAIGDISGDDIAQIAGTVVSSKISADANRDAARRAEAGANAQAEAIREGNELAQDRFETLEERTAIGTRELQRLAASDPSQLTPAQLAQLEEAQRSTAIGLNASGLRGAGRATVAAFKDVEGDFRNRAVESNRTRKVDASNRLAGVNVNAIGQQAGIDRATGQAEGTAANRSGLFDAGATTANASLTGQAIGDITAIIAGEEKAKGRKSKFRRESDDNGDQVTLGGRV